MKLFDVLLTIQKKNKKLMIFGAGTIGHKIIKMIFRYYGSIKVISFLDNNEKIWNTKIMGIPVLNPNVLINQNKEDVAIIIASEYYDEIADQIQKLGYKPEHHFWNGYILNNQIEEFITLWNHKEDFFIEANVRKLLQCNSRFRNCYKNQRCFIMGNAPSINKQDLRQLSNEYVFSVNSGYHHPLYDVIKPQYHCITHIPYNEKLTEEAVINWFREMDSKLGDAELFLNYKEEKLIVENKLFTNRRLNYLCLEAEFLQGSKEVFDITDIIPWVQTVPILCLIIAIYMGFKEIYLIGVDQDSFRTGEYKYFHEPTVLKGIDIAVSCDGKIITPLYEVFRDHAEIWRQFYIIKDIAEHNGINIYNATCGGAVDVFPRVELQDVLKEQVRT